MHAVRRIKSWTKRFTLGVLLGLLVLEVVIVAPVRVNVSQTEAEPHPKSGDGAEQMMTGVHLVETNENGKEWELWSETAVGFKEAGKWLLSAVKVRFFGKDGTFYVVTGDKGTVIVQKKDIEIVGNVQMKSSNGYVFRTPKVIYNSESRSLVGPGEVFMKSPESAENGLLELQGKNLMADLKSNVINVREAVKASRALKEGDDIHIQSHQAVFSGQNSSASFSKEVVVDLGVTRITGPHAQFEYDKESKKLSALLVDGGARISDLSRWATADRIQMQFLKDEVILNGSPLVVQNGNELRGEQIVLSKGGKQIRVQGARAKLETPDEVKGTTP